MRTACLPPRDPQHPAPPLGRQSDRSLGTYYVPGDAGAAVTQREQVSSLPATGGGTAPGGSGWARDKELELQ